MNTINVKNLIAVCNAKLLCGNEDTIISSFSKDTRSIKENDTYVGIKGENFDGNIFGINALENKANGFITDSAVSNRPFVRHRKRKFVHFHLNTQGDPLTYRARDSWQFHQYRYREKPSLPEGH